MKTAANCSYTHILTKGRKATKNSSMLSDGAEMGAGARATAGFFAAISIEVEKPYECTIQTRDHTRRPCTHSHNAHTQCLAHMHTQTHKDGMAQPIHCLLCAFKERRERKKRAQYHIYAKEHTKNTHIITYLSRGA